MARDFETTVSSTDDEQTLVLAAQSGDKAAFRTLLERHQRRLYAVAFGVLRNEQDALDVLQEAMVKIFRNLAKFEGTSASYTWAYRITSNLCIDHLRRNKRFLGDSFEEEKSSALAADRPSDGVLADMGNPGSLLQRKEIRHEVALALDELSANHRTVIVLREIEGCSYEEMATAMGCSKGTIMSRLFHARRNLQAKLKQRLPNIIKRSMVMLINMRVSNPFVSIKLASAIQY